MKPHVVLIVLASLLCGSTAFAVSRGECESAYNESSASRSCGSLYKAADVGGKCGIRTYCKTPDGTEVENGKVGVPSNPYGADQMKKDPRGESTTYSNEGLLTYTLDELRQLVNCNGHLKIGSCN